jgi:hypothetical protein
MIRLLLAGGMVAGVATGGGAQDLPGPSEWMGPLIAAWQEQDAPPGLERVWIDPNVGRFRTGDPWHEAVWPKVQLEAIPEIQSGTWRIAPVDCLQRATTLLQCGLGTHDAVFSFEQPHVRDDSLEVLFRARWYILGRPDRLDGGLYGAILIRDESSWRVEQLTRRSVVLKVEATETRAPPASPS